MIPERRTPDFKIQREPIHENTLIVKIRKKLLSQTVWPNWIAFLVHKKQEQNKFIAPVFMLWFMLFWPSGLSLYIEFYCERIFFSFMIHVTAAVFCDSYYCISKMRPESY